MSLYLCLGSVDVTQGLIRVEEESFVISARSDDMAISSAACCGGTAWPGQGSDDAFSIGTVCPRLFALRELQDGWFRR